jgi:hypothetical protein
MFRSVALVRTEVSDERRAFFIRVTRIGELGTTLGVTSNRRNIPEDAILHSHPRENLGSYILIIRVRGGGGVRARIWPSSNYLPVSTAVIGSICTVGLKCAAGPSRIPSAITHKLNAPGCIPTWILLLSWLVKFGPKIWPILPAISCTFLFNYILIFIIAALISGSVKHWRPPLCSSGQSSWLLNQRSRVRFPGLPDFLSTSGSVTGSSQPREDIWGATWKKSSGSRLENWD